ncbi:unnamed protein product [Lampetra fluviatilis]
MARNLVVAEGLSRSSRFRRCRVLKTRAPLLGPDPGTGGDNERKAFPRYPVEESSRGSRYHQEVWLMANCFSSTNINHKRVNSRATGGTQIPAAASAARRADTARSPTVTVSIPRRADANNSPPRSQRRRSGDAVEPKRAAAAAQVARAHSHRTPRPALCPRRGRSPFPGRGNEAEHVSFPRPPLVGEQGRSRRWSACNRRR